MKQNNRWVLLEHVGAPDDLLGIHFDLLLEDIAVCRTWRLNEIPNPDRPLVDIVPLANHSLRWLDIEQSILSKGRGSVKRIDSGIYKGDLPKEESPLLKIEIFGNYLSGVLLIKNRTCRISSRKHNLSF